MSSNIMRSFSTSVLAIFAAIALMTESAHAQQPPDVVNSDTYNNTASGTNALLNLQAGGGGGGNNNSAFGYSALQSNTTGYNNNAVGYFALYSNTTGIHNNALGFNALEGNTTGYDNTALGHAALFSNLTGYENTAAGRDALWSNTVGNLSVAFGAYALYSNTTGASNSAVGSNALYTNSTGANNTAFGYEALFSNTSGKGNAAQGTFALYSNTTGIRNLGIGNDALYDNVSGSYNIALGFNAGYNVTTGSNNIEIGTSGNAADNNTIQIGVQGTQTLTTIAGIYGTPVSGSAVYVTSTGQLGVQASSERYKTDIAPMPEMRAKLDMLRPVTFHYTNDSRRVPQYGLIAEEVDKVYPELVIRDGSGEIQGVHYEELAPLLLQEVQHLRHKVQDQQEQLRGVAELKQQVAELKRLNRSMQAAITALAQRPTGTPANDTTGLPR